MTQKINNPNQHSVELDVLNDLGIHARVAARIAATLQQFDCEVILMKDQVEAEGDSILSILTLDAPKGSTIIATACGSQAEEALQALQSLFASRFGD